MHLTFSDAARIVFREELILDLPEDMVELQTFLRKSLEVQEGSLTCYGVQDWYSPLASGSSAPGALVVCPCSGGTLASIAQGLSGNLVERAADVMLKEGRKLVLVPRETPVSAIHLENMLKLSRLGATILPASPGFYDHPGSVGDLVDFVVARILDQLGISRTMGPRWGTAPS